MERASDEAELLDPNVLRMLHEFATPDAPDPAREVAQTFFEVMPERLARLQKAAEQGEADEVRRLAHQVRGSCSAVGAHSRCSRLPTSSKKRATPSIRHR
ncbi:MAG TPA: Hpt domain-containing protein, partial [Chloroflexota bacterium]|nr:Hpt domain-containing protein [Chloroflexota bacterium]